MPLDAQSAGLSAVGTWCHAAGSRASRMVEMRFPTKVQYLLGLPSSQTNTIVLSHQAWTSSRGMSRASRMEVKSLASKAAPQSSNLGMESCFKGVTLVFAATNTLDGIWLR